MWNNTINSLTIAFMSLVLTMYAKFIEVKMEIEQGVEIEGVPAFIILFLALISYIVVITRLLYTKSAKELEDENFKLRFGIVYEDLHLHRHPAAKY